MNNSHAVILTHEHCVCTFMHALTCRDATCQTIHRFLRKFRYDHDAWYSEFQVFATGFHQLWMFSKIFGELSTLTHACTHTTQTHARAHTHRCATHTAHTQTRSRTHTHTDFLQKEGRRRIPVTALLEVLFHIAEWYSWVHIWPEFKMFFDFRTCSQCWNPRWWNRVWIEPSNVFRSYTSWSAKTPGIQNRRRRQRRTWGKDTRRRVIQLQLDVKHSISLHITSL